MSNPVPKDMLSVATRIDVELHAKNGASKKGSGSGFWVKDALHHPARFMDFVTNRHVVDMWYNSRAAGYSLTRVRLQSFDVDGNAFPAFTVESGYVVVRALKNDKLDLALLSFDFDHLASYLHSLPGKQVMLSNADLMDGSDRCKDMPWGAQISFVSYQAWVDSKVGRPILRTGTVASDPRHDYQSNEINRDDIYLLEAMSFAGSSGSLVIANPEGDPFRNSIKGPGIRPYRPPYIIGIMSGHLRNERDSREMYKMHTGLSYCHKVSPLVRILAGEEEMLTLEGENEILSPWLGYFLRR